MSDSNKVTDAGTDWYICQIREIFNTITFSSTADTNKEALQQKYELALSLCNDALLTFCTRQDTETISRLKLESLWMLGRKNEFLPLASNFLNSFPNSPHALQIIERQIEFLLQNNETEETISLIETLPEDMYKPLIIKERFWSRLKNKGKAAKYRFMAEKLIFGKTANNTLALLNGDSLNIGALHGNVLLINFWAPDAIGAKKNYPLPLLAQKYSAAPDFQILNIGVGSPLYRIKDSLEKNPIPGVQAVADFDDILEFGIDAIPGYVILDRQGRIYDKSVHGDVERIYDFFYIDGVLSTLLDGAQNTDMFCPPRMYELQGDVCLLEKDSTTALHLYLKSYKKNPQNLRLAVNLARLIEPHDKVKADSLFDAAFLHLQKRRPIALSLRSASAYITAIELIQHYNSVNDRIKVDTLQKFKSYYENRPPTLYRSETTKFKKNLAALTPSLISIQTSEGAQLGVILTRTGYILLPSLSSTDNLIAKSGEFEAPLTVVHKDSQITLLKLNDKKFLRPINFYTKAFKTKNFYFYAVVQDSTVSFCPHSGNKFIFKSNTSTWQVKRKKKERPGGFLFNSTGSLTGMESLAGQAGDSLIFISAMNVLTHIERIGLEKIFKENRFPKPEYNFNHIALPLQTSIANDSTVFYVDIPQPGYYAIYVHLTANAAKEKINIIANNQHRSWTLKNLMRGSHRQPLIFDDQKPQGLSAIDISQNRLNLIFISKQIQIDSLFILNNFKTIDKTQQFPTHD